MYESQGYKLGMKLGISDKNALFVKIRRDGSEREVYLLMKKGKANTAFRRGLKSAAADLRKGKRRPATRKKTTRQRLTTARRPASKRDVLDRSAQTEALKVLKQRYVAEGYTKRESARLAREDLNALEMYLESGIDPKTGKAPRLKDIDYPGKRKRKSSKRKSSSRTSSRKDRSVAQDWNQKETTKWFATLGEKIGNFKVWDSWVYAVVDQPVELRASYASGSLEDPGMVWEITQIKGQPAVLTSQESGRGRSVERHTGTLAQMKKKLVAISRRKRKNPRGRDSMGRFV